MNTVSRRDFLKLVGLGAGVAAMAPFAGTLKSVSALANPTTTTPTPISEKVMHWYQWAYSFPEGVKTDPVSDNTGQVIQQQQPPLERSFFLTGSYDRDAATRQITITDDRELFFPVLCCAWSNLELKKANSAADLVQASKKYLDGAALKAELDGQPLSYIRSTAPPFYMNLPKNNAFIEGHSGLTMMAADGYWVELNPLPKGEHLLHLKGATPGYYNQLDYRTEASYNIKVVNA